VSELNTTTPIRSWCSTKCVEEVLKVLHIQKVAGIAGSENHLLTLLPRLGGAGYRPKMLVLADRDDKPESFVERMQASGVAAKILPMKANLDSMLIGRLVRYLRQDPPAVVHTHLFHADLYGGLAARLGGVRHVVSTKHGFDPWRMKRPYGLLDRLAASLQQEIICISHAIRKWLIQVEGLPAEKMRVIHYAIDAERFLQPARARPVFGQFSKPVIGAVTRLLEQKGVHVLLQAFAACLRRYPRASLVIAGDGPARSELESQATVLGIENSLHFLGYVAHPELRYVMESFDVFALPTFGEGFGLVLLEAMALRKPVVATNVMAIPEVVTPGKTGLLVPPGDASALANALVTLLGDAALREELGRAGRQRALGEFTVERMVRQTVELYDALLGQVPGGSLAGSPSGAVELQ
jgi:glycosyltransferase involved in cell wall biosynthesis